MIDCYDLSWYGPEPHNNFTIKLNGYNVITFGSVDLNYPQQKECIIEMVKLANLGLAFRNVATAPVPVL